MSGEPGAMAQIERDSGVRSRILQRFIEERQGSNIDRPRFLDSLRVRPS